MFPLDTLSLEALRELQTTKAAELAALKAEKARRALDFHRHRIITPATERATLAAKISRTALQCIAVKEARQRKEAERMKPKPRTTLRIAMEPSDMLLAWCLYLLEQDGHHDIIKQARAKVRESQLKPDRVKRLFSALQATHEADPPHQNEEKDDKSC